LSLRSGLHYSNGQPIRAGDFEYAIERLLRGGSAGSSFYEDIRGAGPFQRSQAKDISGIQANDRTGRITIRLNHPRGTFPQELALMYAAPVPRGTPPKDQTTRPPPASGPYKIIASEPSRSWIEKQNSRWSSAARQGVPVPGGHVRQIDFQVVDNPSTQVDEVERGGIDWMFESPPPDRLQDIQERFSGSQFRSVPTNSTYFFWMNSATAPFDDVRVRKAVNYAVDPQALRRIYAGQLTPSQQILPAHMPGYRRFKFYPHDMRRARRLIERAAPRDQDVTVWTDDESPNDDAATYYQDLLERLGFHATLKTIGANSYFGVIGSAQTKDLDTGFSDWFESYPHPADFFNLLNGRTIQPANNLNLSRTDVASIDRRIGALARRPLSRSTIAGYRELDRAVMKVAPWAPYGSRQVGVFVSRRVALKHLIWNPTFGVDLTSFRLRP